MNIADIPLLSILRERMSWLNTRQTTLSENVANADTPGYTARDLKPLDFEAVLKSSTHNSAGSLAVTDPHHISVTNSTSQQFDDQESADTDANPTGNTVSLEEEMIKVADTQAQYQAAANLYSKAVNLLRTAIGKPGS